MSRPSPEELERERQATRQKLGSESILRDSLRGQTAAGPLSKQDFVRDFLAEAEIDRYPAAELEARILSQAPGTVHARLTTEIGYVLWANTPPAKVSPSTIAQALLTSYDEDLGADLATAPAMKIEIERVLAHLESLRFGLEKKTSAAIAARAFALLRGAASPPAAATAAGPPPPQLARALCMDCGAEIDGPICRACAPPPPPPPETKLPAPPAAPAAPLREPVPDPVGIPEAEADLADDIPGETHPPPPTPPKTRGKSKSRRDDGHTLLIDFTGDRMRVGLVGETMRFDSELEDEDDDEEPPDPSTQVRKQLERRVVGHVRARVAMAFNAPDAWDELPQGLVLERLDPTSKERARLDDFEKAGRQHIVVRWNGKARFVPSRDVERIDEGQ